MRDCLTTEIQRYSLQDGPGIRTTIFIKGCPLRCPWCHNPETQNPSKELYYYIKKCTRCGKCVEICPSGAITIQESPQGELCIHTDRETCDLCMACVEACPAQARAVVGQERPIDDIVKIAVSDKLFYKNSGGGVTISGGDPLMFPDFSLELAKRIKAEGIHLVLETSGFPKFDIIQPFLSFVDLFILDIKTMDAEKHKAVIGGSLNRILSNIEKLLSLRADVRIHLPIIPNFNDTDEDFQAYIDYLSPLADQLDGIDVLPFHVYGENKYNLLERGANYVYKGQEDLDQTVLLPLVKGLKKVGIKNITIGGLMGLGDQKNGS